MKSLCRALTQGLFLLLLLFLAGCACTTRVCNLTPGSIVVFQGAGKNGIRTVGTDGCVDVPCDTNVTPVRD